MTDKIGKKEATFAVPYNGEDNNDYIDGKGFCCNDGSLEAAQARSMAANIAKAKAVNGNFKENDDYEKMQFYYNPDHLGSSIVVKRNGKPSVKFSFGSKTDNPFGGQLVKVSYMDEEKSMKGEAPSNFVKNRIVITPPSDMTVEQFDEMVIKTGNSFGNNPNITYCLEPFEQTQGNCNSSSSTLLYKAGVPLSRIKDLRKQISGLVWGFGDIKPWTVEEQSKAVQRQRELDQLRNEMMNTIILNKY